MQTALNLACRVAQCAKRQTGMGMPFCKPDQLD